MARGFKTLIPEVPVDSSKIIREKELAIKLLRKLIAIAATRNLGGSEIKYAEDAMKVLEK